jgi:hypothetical protein
MTMTQSKAREGIQEITEKFRRERAAGQINQYNESETKTGFIEPLLQALGWNNQDRNEVGLEEKISGGRVDYSLKIKGSPKIYIEAKPPRAKLTKPEAISQAITYGYNKRSVPWVLLTDFQELRLFDVTIRPNKRNLEAGLRMDLTVAIDFPVLKEIILETYDPYLFDVIGVEVLGNIYALFVERGLQLLKPGGILGFILPHKFFQAAYGQGLRKLIAEKNALMEVVNFRDNQIFEQASTYMNSYPSTSLISTILRKKHSTTIL